MVTFENANGGQYEIPESTTLKDLIKLGITRVNLIPEEVAHRTPIAQCEWREIRAAEFKA